MYTQFVVSHSKSTERQVAAAEARCSSTFPEKFKKFYLNFNAATLKHCEVVSTDEFGQEVCFSIRQLWPIDEVGKKIIEYLDDDMIIFAEDDVGNWFAINKSDMGRVLFINHETNEAVEVSESFQKFLSSMREQVSTDAEVPDDATGWVSPDFLKMLKEYQKKK